MEAVEARFTDLVAGDQVNTGGWKGVLMTALLILLVIIILFGAGFVVKMVWWLAVAALALWLIGFAAHGPQRRWYRW